MITDHVPAVGVPPDHATSRTAAASLACGDVEDRRDLDPAPPARRPAAAAAAPPEAELGRPGPARGTAQRDTQSPPPRAAACGHPRDDPSLWPRAAAAAPPEAELGRPGPARGTAQRDTQSPPPRAAACGHPGDDPSLAPRHRPPPLGGAVHARQDRPPGHPPQRPWPRPPAGPRKPRMGLPQDPRRAGRPGSEDSSVHGMGDSEERRNRPRAAPDRAHLVTVPALPGRSDPGLRLLHRRPARPVAAWAALSGGPPPPS